MNIKIKTKVIVIGSGPGGYSAAFRCADLGLDTILLEQNKNLGGVCLNVGCIPSKSLLHISKIIKDSFSIKNSGILFDKPKIDLKKLRNWKNNIICKITKNLKYMAKIRNVKIITGYGKFIGSNNILVINNEFSTNIEFDKAIVAAGSSTIHPSYIPYDDRIWNSTDALELKCIPKNMLIIGGGIIGLEIASIYSSLGSKIDLIEKFDQIIPSADTDIIKYFTNILKSKINIILNTEIKYVKPKKDGVYVKFLEKNKLINKLRYDNIVIAIGRAPNGNILDASNAGLYVNNKGFIPVDNQMRTNISHIYAIGDITGQPMLAHKSSYQGRLVAEIIIGKKYYFETKIIPFIGYTDPEIAWVGLTEKEAKENNIEYEISVFPWTASGRAIACNCTEGLTKLIFNKLNNRLIGGAIIGSNGGELLGEISLAIEMGCNSEDISLTIHAHPTLYESISSASEIYQGTIVDMINSKS
ncbi:MAG: dihydrolipoyl dehydrogenase [Candidatus Makana argininalis]